MTATNRAGDAKLPFATKTAKLAPCSTTSDPLLQQLRCGFQDPDVVLPFLVAGILLLSALGAWLRCRRVERLTFLLLAMVVALVIVGCVDLFSPKTARGRWDLAAFPTVVVLAHGFAQFRLRRPNLSPMAVGDLKDDERETMARLRRSVNRQFGPVRLILRYLVPSFFIFWLCLSIPNTLLRQLAVHFPATAGLVPQPSSITEIPWPAAPCIAALYGVAGAYCYVVLNLAYRTFRDDITPGSAYWCAATLAAGPTIAGVIGMFWPTLTLTTPFDKSRIFEISTLFFVGFSPRYGIAIIEGAAREGWKWANSTEKESTNTLSVTTLRGVTSDTAVRLAEEGITSVSAMAGADPVRLLRNTRYDKGQIVTWIDRALLIEKLPAQWQKLEEAGVTTASSLAAHKADAAMLDSLAELSGTKSLFLQGAAAQLAGDAAVKTLTLLRKLEMDGEVDADDDFEHAAPSMKLSRGPAPRLPSPDSADDAHPN